MPYTPPEIVKEIMQIDLLTYLQNYEPEELVRVGTNTYTTKTHDSLRISNGLWNWFSRGLGGRSAVDYIKEEKNLTFKEAIDFIAGKTKIQAPVFHENNKRKEEKIFSLPKRNENNNKAKRYLENRGIATEIIEECIKQNLIYEEKNTSNVVFVGYDNKNAKYAFCRGTIGKRFMKEVEESNKAFAFRLLSNIKSNRVHLFESAIDLLSYATLMKYKNLDYHRENLISLGGVFKPAAETKTTKIPITLERFLMENSNITDIFLHFDNDEIGQKASENLIKTLSSKYQIFYSPPPFEKDCNDYLRYVINTKNFNRITKENVR